MGAVKAQLWPQAAPVRNQKAFSYVQPLQARAAQLWLLHLRMPRTKASFALDNGHIVFNRAPKVMARLEIGVRLLLNIA